jgi:hypothetical protein
MFVVNIFFFTAGQRYPLTGSAALHSFFIYFVDIYSFSSAAGQRYPLTGSAALHSFFSSAALQWKKKE